MLWYLLMIFTSILHDQLDLVWIEQLAAFFSYRAAILGFLCECNRFVLKITIETQYVGYCRLAQVLNVFLITGDFPSQMMSYFAKSTEPSWSNFFLIFFTFFYVLSYLHSMDTILAVFLIVVRCPFESQRQSELSRSD